MHTKNCLHSLSIVDNHVSYCSFYCNPFGCVCSKQKKGIKSSIGRLFGKKEKGGRMEPTVGRDGQPLSALSGTLPIKYYTLKVMQTA